MRSILSSIHPTRYSPLAAQYRPFFSVPSLPSLPSFGSDNGKNHRVTKIFRHSAAEVFAVVEDIEKYSYFVPYCSKSVVTSRDDRTGRLLADLAVGVPPVTEKYTSRVSITPFEKIVAESHNTMILEHLLNVWTFSPGPTVGPDKRETCMVEFYISFKFRSPVYAALASTMFDTIAQQTLRAFEERCDQLYHVK
eukprot:CFRG0916T1